MKTVLCVALIACALAVGGWEDVADQNDEEVLSALEFASQAVSEQFKTKYHAKRLAVHRIRKQIVAGVNYKFELDLAITNCKKADMSYEEMSSRDCELNEKEYPRKCEAIVYFQSWTNTRKLIHFNCILKSLQAHKSIEKGSIDKQLVFEKNLFDKFIEKYQKVYNNSTEKEKRFRIFQDNLKKINIFNKLELGTARYGVTQFADLSESEFRKRHLGLRPSLAQSETLSQAEIFTDFIPDSFDWRDHNAVTPVKDQGMCGSCWAFSTTGNIEGQWAIMKHKLISLSEQELIDCDKLDEGCNGGLPSNAYKEIIRLGGLETEKEYPYEGENEKCTFNKTEFKIFINSSTAISQNETEMAVWLVKNGPISIGINANAMQFYFGGISHPWKFLCNPNNLDHGVLIVGYGVHTYPIFKRRIPFWIVKNSWGESWGEQGYYRVYRGDGTCGVNKMATSSIIQ